MRNTEDKNEKKHFPIPSKFKFDKYVLYINRFELKVISVKSGAVKIKEKIKI